MHLDIKPGNVLVRADGSAVLIDFGLSWHGQYPDLLAEEMRVAIGSPPWMAPEQVVGVRGDPRSDVFAIGVMLYELATGELPFGGPRRGRPAPAALDGSGAAARPRARTPAVAAGDDPALPRAGSGDAASAAHLAFDLANPDQVQVGERGKRTHRTVAGALRRWIKAAGMHYRPSPLPTRVDRCRS